ncbi:MAG: glycosyltransferase family 2 protein [Bryobacteraceae bacterium]
MENRLDSPLEPTSGQASRDAARPSAELARLPVSVVIPVLNEEANLADCLASVSWADEVFVVDSHSTDRTVEIAAAAGAKVVQFHFQPGGPRKKNWALENLPFRNAWVLILDADERITPELEAEIRRVFEKGPLFDGYYLNRKLIFMGRWLKHGGNYPSWNLRLFKHRLGRYERLNTEELASAGDVEVHEHVVLDGRAGFLREPMRHLDFKDLSAWIERHNRYSTWDARMRLSLLRGENFSRHIPARLSGNPIERKRWLKRLWVRLPGKPLLRFLYMYFFRLGFLDGRPGFIYAVLKATHEFHISAKMWEMGLSTRR